MLIGSHMLVLIASSSLYKYQNLYNLCSVSYSSGGLEANQNLRDRFSSAVSTTLEDADAANNNLHTSIDSVYHYPYI